MQNSDTKQTAAYSLCFFSLLIFTYIVMPASVTLVHRENNHEKIGGGNSFYFIHMLAQKTMGRKKVH